MTLTSIAGNSNVASTNGGFLYVSNLAGCSSYLTIASSTMNSNAATSGSGGIASLNCPNTNSITINGASTINTATAGLHGGIGYLVGTTTVVSVASSTISSTSAA